MQKEALKRWRLHTVLIIRQELANANNQLSGQMEVEKMLDQEAKLQTRAKEEVQVALLELQLANQEAGQKNVNLSTKLQQVEAICGELLGRLELLGQEKEVLLTVSEARAEKLQRLSVEATRERNELQRRIEDKESVVAAREDVLEAVGNLMEEIMRTTLNDSFASVDAARTWFHLMMSRVAQMVRQPES